MMSDAIQKRYRQINIKESFALAKKARSDRETPTMDQNLRELMAAAALKRIEDSKKEPIINNPVPNTNKFEDMAGSAKSPITGELGLKIAAKFEEMAGCSAGPPSKPKDAQDNHLPSTSGYKDESAELFPDSPVVEQCSSQERNSNPIIESFFIQEDIEEYSDPEENDLVTLLNRIPGCSIPLPPLEPLENHSIMFSTNIRHNETPRPYPSTYRDKWDDSHVRMPCSPESKFPVEQNGKKIITSRWDLICGSLRRRILTSHDLEEAIMAYNSLNREKWNFDGLHSFFDTCFTDTEREYIFDWLIPKMVNLALDLPNICTQPPPLLKNRRDHYLSLSQKQISCLLANAFFCTFPRRNNTFRGSRNNHEYASYPDINFNRLFSGRGHKMSSTNQKLKCLIHYFNNVLKQTTQSTGTVTFHRQYLPKIPKWNSSIKGIRTAFVKRKGLIEADGRGLLQVDFANKFVGGGVLGAGCIQEEIRFVICPELIVSRLFVEALTPNEALIVTGVQQYCKYKGYSDSFQWDGPFCDNTVRDAWGRRCTEVVAINATEFSVPSVQYRSGYIRQELDKAYCGFYQDGPSANLSAIATGNWGCGAFKGDPHLKFIIQLMAASEVGRDILYFTFGNKTLKKDLEKIYNLLSDQNLSVGDVFRILEDYSSIMRLVKNEPSPKLLYYLNDLFSSKDSNQSPVITDSDQNALQKLIQDVEKEGTDETDIELNNPS